VCSATGPSGLEDRLEVRDAVCTCGKCACTSAGNARDGCRGSKGSTKPGNAAQLNDGRDPVNLSKLLVMCALHVQTQGQRDVPARRAAEVNWNHSRLSGERPLRTRPVNLTRLRVMCALHVQTQGQRDVPARRAAEVNWNHSRLSGERPLRTRPVNLTRLRVMCALHVQTQGQKDVPARRAAESELEPQSPLW
jgi:hypothetical protein